MIRIGITQSETKGIITGLIVPIGTVIAANIQ